VSQDRPNPPNPGPDSKLDPKNAQPGPAPAAGEGMGKSSPLLPGNFRWPKPNAEAVAAAVEAIHRMSGSAAAEDLAAAGQADEPSIACASCGGSLPPDARFCVWCGIPTQSVAVDPAAPHPQYAASAQHHIHHHYHHHLVPGQLPGQIPGQAGQTTPSGIPFASSELAAPRGRAPASAGGSLNSSASNPPGGRAEAGARQVAQDWAQACNTKHIDDLLELYAADATLIRSSVAPVRSLPAIREFLVSLLDAGLGDIEMESLRLEVMGEVALDLGRCKMLVPVALGKRREERGKYLIVLVRQPTGTWKILADCWSADLAVTAPPKSTTNP